MRVAAIAAAVNVAIVSFTSQATTYTWVGGTSGLVSTGANWDPVPQGAFTEADEWLISSPVRLTLDAATTVGKISLDSRENITFLTSGDAVLTVTRVVNSGKGVARFCCPVQFAGTWLVEQTGAVKFPAGVTATYPDPSIRTSSSSDVARSLDGIFTFTDDWSVPSISDGNHPWLLRPGSQIVGRNLTGSESGGRILYISEGASACFDTVSIGFKKGDIGLDGFLEAKKEENARKTIVVLLPDTGERYLSSMNFDD
jgi:hypothetical protein